VDTVRNVLDCDKWACHNLNTLDLLKTVQHVRDRDNATLQDEPVFYILASVVITLSDIMYRRTPSAEMRSDGMG